MMLHVVALTVFIVSLTAIAATYVLYPLVLIPLSRLRRREAYSQGDLPHLTLIISAFNEAEFIGKKIENSLALDYPPDRLQILVISDASDDGTDEIVQQFADPRIVLCRQEPRGGKSRGITTFMPRATGEIVVFSDANSMYDHQALRFLATPFSDPRVGYVVGYQRYLREPSSSVSSSESAYWQYETWLKEAESRFSSVVGGDGAIYAFRRALWVPLRDDDISDLVLPLRIVARGSKGVYERRAVCDEHTAADFGGEFRRKVRIVNRSLRGVLRVPAALNPLKVGWFAPQLFVHKVLRWFVPFFLIAVFVSNLLLWNFRPPVFQILLALQLAFYGLAVLCFVPGLCRLKVVYFAYYFCLVNIAAARGVLGLLAGQRFVVWSPQRETVAEAASITESPAGHSK